MGHIRPATLGVAALLTATLALPACGGSDDSSSPASTTASTTTAPADGSSADDGSDTTTAGKGSAKLPADVCALLPADQVTALLGSPTTGAKGAESRNPENPQFASCLWGELTSPTGQVSLAVSVPMPEIGIDYLQTVFGGAGPTTPVPVGEGGKLADRFVRTGGGGTGKTILFKKDGLTVALGQSGDTVDAAKLQTAAQQVAEGL
ncbi:MAG: hypothetical protein ACOYOP_13090 [Microthrixaceae bacterium]